ncbi:MAG: peptidase C25, partial [Candidatus Thermoplasmatota archaeon]|nr:peptidase C25 [Candidatus Thermoplasmatota archaeon]MBU1941889.1 peptidase C25 [Candidatus Thermoplasmatota archaeon]
PTITISTTKTIETTLQFPEPQIRQQDNNYITLTHPTINQYLQIPGKPKLPIQPYHIELPFGATNIQIHVTPYVITQQTLQHQILPAQKPQILGTTPTTNSFVKDSKTYSMNQLYPDTWYTSHIGCGLNANNKPVTHVTLSIYPIRYNPYDNQLISTHSMDITITYTPPETTMFPEKTTYNLIIIASQKFAEPLQKLVDHKNNHNIATMLKTTEEILNEYTGVDAPEQIKYFIKDARETYNTTYFLLIGGLKSQLYAPPRDDPNQGTKGWYVPVRYSNLYDIYENDPTHDPGFLCDLYYADLYKEGGVFDTWNSNNDSIIAARNCPGYPDDNIDLYPDVMLGRFPCRNTFEVNSIINKIITYESTPADPSWFNKIVAIAGDGLQDQIDLNITWDTTTLPNGDYTIYAQSKSLITNEWGPIDNVTITLNHDASSNITFSEDDHLRITTYPMPAIAEITSPSTGDILGNTNIDFIPRQAYMGEYWARVTYQNGIMHIRGKSYDPQPYGFYTDIKCWITNNTDGVIFTDHRNTTRVYFDCEWTTGNQPMGGDRAGAFYYMPESFEKIMLWASNGNFTSQQDVIDTLSNGCGFAFFFGHASPSTMVVNLPGMPGGFSHSAITGLQPLSLTTPIFPMNKITNTNKLPIVMVMGCHNSQFNNTLLRSLTDRTNAKKTWVYGFPNPECWSWWITKIPNRGAIATIGCTGLGPGEFDEAFIPDTGCWIFPELFRQYGQEGHTILGDMHGQTLTSYINTFGQVNMIDVKMVQELALFGDPSMQIGGIS